MYRATYSLPRNDSETTGNEIPARPYTLPRNTLPVVRAIHSQAFTTIQVFNHFRYFCVLQAIKTWSLERPGNEASPWNVLRLMYMK